jgi:hypothetical protein
MEQETKLPPTDTNKKRFIITIDVRENCHKFSVSAEKGEKVPTYYELIGVMQTQILRFQMEQNIQNFKTWIKEKENLENSTKNEK